MSDKNAAIVIAVSDYQRVSTLPACKNDGSLVWDVLRETGRFKPENIFYADTDTDSGTIKPALPKFIEEAVIVALATVKRRHGPVGRAVGGVWRQGEFAKTIEAELLERYKLS